MDDADHQRRECAERARTLGLLVVEPSASLVAELRSSIGSRRPW